MVMIVIFQTGRLKLETKLVHLPTEIEFEHRSLMEKSMLLPTHITV